jgi:HK97 family phage major capsid protein
VGNVYLEKLQEDREGLHATAKGILDLAAAEDRYVTDDERKLFDEHRAKIEEIDKEIEPIRQLELRQANHDRARAETVRAVKSQQAAGVAGSGGLDYYRGKPGLYLADHGAKRRDPQAAARLQRAHAEYRVVADQKLADNPGIVPVPIVGPVQDTLLAARPFLNSVTNRPMPGGGATFLRPRITQHALVALQATEKTQLASQKLTLDSISVPKKTYGGTLDISFQDRDWTDPAILDIAVQDLAALFANTTDDAAADAFVTAATGTFVLAEGATAAATQSAYLGAIAAVYSGVKRMPDTIWMSPDDWAVAAGLTVAGSGAPAFPGVASGTTMGGTILGLNVVVDSNFAANTTVIGVSSYVEHYEQAGSLLAVEEPTILGYTIAYYGYVADVMLNVGAFKKQSAT